MGAYSSVRHLEGDAMGTLGGSNGDNWPPDGGGVPDLPPEWGPIVVPDDPAELAEESARVRRELQDEARRRARTRRISRLTGHGRRPGGRRTPSGGRAGPSAGWRGFRSRGRDPGGSPLRLSILIMMTAILATVTSLFILAWPAQPRPVPGRSDDTARTAPAPRVESVPALDLLDASGKAVPLRGLLPAVILITDGCECTNLVADTAVAVPPGITVAAVAARAPKLTGSGVEAVRTLADPAGELRSTLGLQPLPGTAVVLLVARDADIIRTVPAASSITSYRDDLAALAATNG